MNRNLALLGRQLAGIWKQLPKIVFSKTLEKVEGNARLVRDGVAEEVAKLKEQPGKDLAVGGAGLASALIKLDLIDEYRLFVSPVVLGGGTPYFPALEERFDLELVETQTFGGRVARYGSACEYLAPRTRANCEGQGRRGAAHAILHADVCRARQGFREGTELSQQHQQARLPLFADSGRSDRQSESHTGFLGP